MPGELPGAVKGMVVGFCNTILVAVCIAAGSAPVAVVVCILGCLPGILTGALLGDIAAARADLDRKLLLGMMIAASCLVVAALGEMFSARELVLVSWIPTAAACSVLERWTRRRPDESLPLARVA